MERSPLPCRPRLLAVLALTLVVGCSKKDGPDIEYQVLRDSVELGRTDHTEAMPLATWSMLNTGGATMVVSVLGFEGEGSQYLRAEFTDYSEVRPSQSGIIRITLDGDTLTWDSGDYNATLLVQLGSLWNNPRDFSDDPNWQADTLKVPVHFELVCDIDSDGVEASACGGDDCDDNDSRIYPGAAEVCGDNIDNNCDGRVDPPQRCGESDTDTDADTDSDTDTDTDLDTSGTGATGDTADTATYSGSAARRPDRGWRFNIDIGDLLAPIFQTQH